MFGKSDSEPIYRIFVSRLSNVNHYNNPTTLAVSIAIMCVRLTNKCTRGEQINLIRPMISLCLNSKLFVFYVLKTINRMILRRRTVHQLRFTIRLSPREMREREKFHNDWILLLFIYLVFLRHRYRSVENNLHSINSALKYLRTQDGKSFGTQYPSEWQRRSDFPMSSKPSEHL